MSPLNTEVQAYIFKFLKEARGTYKDRADKVLSEEGVEPDRGLVSLLAEYGCGYAHGATSIELHNRSVERANNADQNRKQKDSIRLRKSVNDIRELLDINPSLTAAIEAKDISLDVVNRVLDVILDGANVLGSAKSTRIKQGNLQKSRSALVLLAWQCLKEKNIQMRKASRIIAMVFDGNTNDDQNIYQTIRNQKIR